MKQLSGQVKGSEVVAVDWNQFPAELQFTITKSGQTLAAALDQLAIAAANSTARGNFYLDTGVADAYVLGRQTPFPKIVVLEVGSLFHFRPTNNNTGASTTTLDDFSAKTIKRESSGADLSANDLVTTKDAKIRYDGTNFLLIGV